uniref:Battenin n=1 Tax=Panagrolaimus sp. JU765 TaxID=591449 RepID=A0AC34R013_9BILA
MINAVFFTFDAVYFFVPQIWIIFILILYEGLLGGSSYVNTYNRLHQDVPANIREFCMPIVSMSDAIGITISGFTAIPLHNFVCNQQKYHI